VANPPTKDCLSRLAERERRRERAILSKVPALGKFDWWDQLSY